MIDLTKEELEEIIESFDWIELVTLTQSDVQESCDKPKMPTHDQSLNPQVIAKYKCNKCGEFYR